MFHSAENLTYAVGEDASVHLVIGWQAPPDTSTPLPVLAPISYSGAIQIQGDRASRLRYTASRTEADNWAKEIRYTLAELGSRSSLGISRLS